MAASSACALFRRDAQSASAAFSASAALACEDALVDAISASQSLRTRSICAREAASYRVRLHPQAGGKTLFTLGAWQGPRLVGALTCEHENRLKVRHIAHLIGMMVDDAVSGRGIGRHLLQQALTLLRREPLLETVTLSVTAGNRAAIALYRRAGFTRYGHLPRAIRLADGSYHAKDLMSLDLRP